LEGRRLAVGNSAGCIEIYDFKSQSARKKSWKISSLSGYVNCICWSNNDRHVAAGNSNGSIALFNTIMHQFSRPLVYTSKSSNSLNGFVKNSVTDIQYSSLNGSCLAAGYEDGSVIIWDVNKEMVSSEFRAHDLPCTSIALSPINNILMVSGGLDSNLNFYDVTSKK
jgi:WD40 repeat protein